GPLPDDGKPARRGLPAGFLPAICGQGPFRTVGVDLDGSAFSASLYKAAARNVNKKLLRPLGFVIIEGVLFGLAVPSDKALAVAPLDAALIPDTAAKVEQVPHKAAPDGGLSGQLGIDCLMVEGLVLLRVVFAPGRLAVVSQITVHPVLRKAEGNAGIVVAELADKAGIV